MLSLSVGMLKVMGSFIQIYPSLITGFVREDLGLTFLQGTIITTCQIIIGQSFGNLFLGFMVDRYGPRNSLLATFLGFALSMTFLSSARSMFEVVVGAVLVEWCGCTLYSSLSNFNIHTTSVPFVFI